MVPVKLFSGQVKLCQAQATLISITIGTAGATTCIKLFTVYVYLIEPPGNYHLSRACEDHRVASRTEFNTTTNWNG